MSHARSGEKQLELWNVVPDTEPHGNSSTEHRLLANYGASDEATVERRQVQIRSLQTEDIYDGWWSLLLCLIGDERQPR